MGEARAGAWSSLTAPQGQHIQCQIRDCKVKQQNFPYDRGQKTKKFL